MEAERESARRYGATFSASMALPDSSLRAITNFAWILQEPNSTTAAGTLATRNTGTTFVLDADSAVKYKLRDDGTGLLLLPKYGVSARGE